MNVQKLSTPPKESFEALMKMF